MNCVLSDLHGRCGKYAQTPGRIGFGDGDAPYIRLFFKRKSPF